MTDERKAPSVDDVPEGFVLDTPGAGTPPARGTAPPASPPASFSDIPRGSNGVPSGFTEDTPKRPAGGGVLLNPGGGTKWGDDQTVPTPPEQKSVTNFLLNQVPGSIINTASNLSHAVIHPIDTLSGMGNLIAGTFKASARAVGMDMPENESDQVARNFADYAMKRWGGVDEIKNALYHDPVGMMMDFSTVLSGAGGLLRGAGALSGIETASTLGRGLTTAGEIANPLYVPGKIASGTISRLITKKLPVEPPPVETQTHPPFNPKNATFGGEEAFDPSTGKFHDVPGGYKSPQPPQPPVDPNPAFNPKTASFAEDAFDPSTGTFGDTPGGGYKSPQPKPPETMQEAVERLRGQWGVKPPKSSGLEPPAQPATAAAPPEPAAAAPPPKPTPPPKPPPEPPPAAPPPKPTAPPAPRTFAQYLGNALAGPGGAGLATTAAIELLTHHLTGAVAGGSLAYGALKYLPILLKSPAGQRALTAIGPGSTAAQVAAVAQGLAPALNTLYQSQLQQESMGQPSVLGRAKGGMVNPELARIQRERLQLPGILGMLEGHK